MYFQNFGRGETWLPGYIVQTLGPVSLEVRLTDGRPVWHHQSQSRKETDGALPDTPNNYDEDVYTSTKTTPVSIPPVSVTSWDLGREYSSPTEKHSMLPFTHSKSSYLFSDSYQ